MNNNLSLLKNRTPWILLIYFFSGACSLIDEVVWVRLLKLTLGNTVYASSIVISVFMGGLALGALVMSRYADSIRQHLRLYAVLETLVTISALSLPWALKIADRFYIMYYHTVHPSPGHLLFIQVLLSALILLVPTMLMGSTLPLLGRFVTGIEKEAGKMVGWLYALNTLGAAVGCFLAGFSFIRVAGVMGTLYIAAGLNLLVAFGGWILSHIPSGAPSPNRSSTRFGTVSGQTPEDMVVEKRKHFLLIAAFFMSGLISIGYELVWMRSIVHLLGGFTYVFSAVLTVYLLGNVIGVSIGSRLAKQIRCPASGFSVTLCFLGIFGILFLPGLIAWTAKGLPLLGHAAEDLSSGGRISPLLVKPFIQSLVLFLAPSVVMGIGFPLALQAWANHVHQVGRSTGMAYAANTIGAVLSGIITGFILVPYGGVQLAITIFGLLGIWVAVLLRQAFSSRSDRIARWAPAGAAALLTLFAVQLPGNLFDRVVQMNPGLMPSQLVDVKEGVATTVSLHRTKRNGTLQLHSSGQSAAGEGFSARGDQKMLAHMAALLNPAAKRVLSVGFGSGETTATLALHHFERIDCVEIAPEMVEMSLKYFGHMNLGDQLNKKVNMIYMDAKHYLRLADSTYDVIINDSIHPRHFAENASLYGIEYFESARARLSDGGVVISWVPTWLIPDAVVGSILKTCMTVFPHVSIWFPTPHYAPLILIAGSNKAQRFVLSDMEAVMKRPQVHASLQKIGINTSMDFMSCYMGDEIDYAELVKPFHVNSDFYPFVEFSTAADQNSVEILKHFVMDIRNSGRSLYSLDRHLDWNKVTSIQKDRWIRGYHNLHDASTCLLGAAVENSLTQVLHRVSDCVRAYPDQPVLAAAQTEAEKNMFQIANIWLHAGENVKALNAVAYMTSLNSDSGYARALQSNIQLKTGNIQQAEAAVREAVVLAPDLPEAHSILGRILAQTGRADEAVLEYEKVWELVQDDISHSLINKAQALYNLADAYAAARQYPQAMSSARGILKMLELSAGHPQMRFKVQRRLKDYEQMLAVMKAQPNQTRF